MALTESTDNSSLGQSGGGSAFLEERSDVTDFEHIALYLMLAFFSVLGVVGNAIAFYIFFHRRNSGTSVIFILALAGTDFISCLVTVPFTIVFEAMQYRLHYDGLCKMYMFFITSTIPYSSFIMAGIAIDRYFCICHPFLHVLNVKRARLVVLSMAVPAFAFGIITAMSHGILVIKDYILLNGTFLLGRNLSRESAEDLVQDAPLLDVSEIDLIPGGHVIPVEVTSFNDSKVYVLQIYRMLVQNEECVTNSFLFTENFQKWFHRLYTSCYALSFVVVMVLYVLIYKFIFQRRAMKVRRRMKNNYVVVETHAPHHRGRNVEAETAMTDLTGNGALMMTTKTAATDSANLNTAPTTTTTATNTTTANADTTICTTSLIEGSNTPISELTTTCADSGGGSATSNATTIMSKANTASTTTTTTTTMNMTEKEAVGGRNSNGTATGVAAGETTRLPKRRGSTTRDRVMYANIKTAMMLFVVTLVFIIAFAPACFMAHKLIPMQLNVFYLYFIYNLANPFIYAFMNQAFREDLKKLLKRS